MPLTGDFHILKLWKTGLSDLVAAGGLGGLNAVAVKMANQTLGFIQKQFATGTTPFGTKWRPKIRPDGRPTGFGKTGRMHKYSIKYTSSRGFAVHSPNAPHRRYFHGGTKRRDQSKIRQVPRRISPGTILPKSWVSAYRKTWRAHCLSKLRTR